MILALVSIPGKDLPELSQSVDHFQPDTVVHVLLFLVFAFLLMSGFDHPSAGLNTPENLCFYALLAGIILGGGTEIFQHFCIPGRNATLKDFLFNSLGCVIGLVLYSFFRKRIHHR